MHFGAQLINFIIQTKEQSKRVSFHIFYHTVSCLSKHLFSLQTLLVCRNDAHGLDQDHNVATEQGRFSRLMS